MSGFLGRRAVVVGAGIGGLSMAGALAKNFERVEILERDRLTASVGSRSGTPQDRHPHGLLAGGLQALGEIFPGFESDLARAGAVSVRVAQDVQYERPDVGALPKRDFGISLLCASRPGMKPNTAHRSTTRCRYDPHYPALRPQRYVSDRLSPASQHELDQRPGRTQQ